MSNNTILLTYIQCYNDCNVCLQVSVDEENQAIRESIIFERKKVFKETEEKVQARWKFEDNIKRPYFHMKSLERSQLKNWSEYLKVESERNSDTSAVEIL